MVEATSARRQRLACRTAAGTVAPMRRLLLLTAAVLVMSAAGSSTVADASSCPDPAGAQPTPPAWPDAEVAVRGGGFGHGVGMSQYGARGAAELGCSAEEILDAYYPTTSTADEPLADEPVRVGLAQHTGREDVTALIDELTWQRCDGGCENVALQPGGQQWQVDADGDEALLRDGDGDVVAATTGRFVVELSTRNPTASAKVASRPYEYRRGELTFTPSRHDAFHVTVELADAELYLRGLAEVPSLWPEATLQAQAVAARTYALRQIAAGGRSGCDCDLLDSELDQVYAGWDKEGAGPAGSHGARWVDAVLATEGQVRQTAGGGFGHGIYASSHGGHRSSAAHIWGGTNTAELAPMNDAAWEAAADNPRLTWTETLSAAEAGAPFGVGELVSVTVTDVDDVGWVTAAALAGSDGTATVTGAELRREWGLPSQRFDVRVDGDGDGVTELGPATVCTADGCEPAAGD